MRDLRAVRSIAAPHLLGIQLLRQINDLGVKVFNGGNGVGDLWPVLAPRAEVFRYNDLSEADGSPL